jgi:hypothetical protein
MAKSKPTESTTTTTPQLQFLLAWHDGIQSNDPKLRKTAVIEVAGFSNSQSTLLVRSVRHAGTKGLAVWNDWLKDENNRLSKFETLIDSNAIDDRNSWALWLADQLRRYVFKFFAAHAEQFPIVENWSHFHSMAESIPNRISQRTYYLLFYLGMSQLETAQIIGVSEAEILEHKITAINYLKPHLPTLDNKNGVQSKRFD